MSDTDWLAEWKQAVADGHTIDGFDGWVEFEKRVRDEEAMAAAIGYAIPSDWLTDDYHGQIGNRVLIALHMLPVEQRMKVMDMELVVGSEAVRENRALWAERTR